MCCPRPAEVMGREGRKFVARHDAARGLAERMTGKSRHAFELASEHRPIVRTGLFVLAGFECFADQSHSGYLGARRAERRVSHNYFLVVANCLRGPRKSFPRVSPAQNLYA